MNKVYEIIQKKVVKNIEDQIKEMQANPAKKFSWVKPWGDSGLPFNDNLGRYYTGINTLLLDKGGAYLTEKVIAERGLKIKKGARYSMVVFWKPIPKKKADKDDTESTEDSEVMGADAEEKKKFNFVLRYYKVYHESDIEGFERKHHIKKDTNNLQPNEIEQEAIYKLDSYCEEESIPLKIVETNKACYIPSLDTIQCPLLEQFNSTSEFISTLAHECIHSTGASNRLNRDILNSFGSEKYSKEELVAEIGASMFLAMQGIEEENTNMNNVAYISGWLEKLKNDITLITYAAQRAQKAVNFITEHEHKEEFSTKEVKGF